MFVGLLSLLLDKAFSRAVVASFRRSPWISRPFDADLSKGEMSFGRGVRKSRVVEGVEDDSVSKATDPPPIVGRVDSGTNDEAGVATADSSKKT